MKYYVVGNESIVTWSKNLIDSQEHNAEKEYTEYVYISIKFQTMNN